MSVVPLPDSPSRVSAARNLGWSVIAQAWTLIVTIASAMALARLLTPADYGVIAASAPVIGIAHQLQAMGFSTAIIQAAEIDKRQLNALFWTSFAISLVLATAVACSAPVVAHLLGDARLRPVLTIAAVAIVALALAAQPSAILSRNLRFRALAMRDIVSVTIATTVSVGIAVATHSYWALVAGMVLGPVLNFILSAILARWVPCMPTRGAKAGAMLHFGFRVWSANLFNFTSRNADNLIVAYAAGPRQLGIYDRAYRLLLYPINHAVIPLGQVMIPTLSRSLDQADRYRVHYWRAVGVLLLLCQPALAIAVVWPATVMGLLLGPGWLQGAPIFGWFAAAGLFQLFQSTTNWLLTSQGRGRTLMHVMLVTSVVALTSFMLGIQWGIRGVAIAYVVGQGLLSLPFTLWAVGRDGPVRHGDFRVRLLPHVSALALVLGMVLLTRAQFGLPRWPLLLTVTVMAYGIYGLVLMTMAGSRDLAQGLIRQLRSVTRPQTALAR